MKPLTIKWQLVNQGIPRYGYKFDYDSNNEVLIVTGADWRGAFYGTLTLAELVNDQGISIAEIFDYPWLPYRYAGDYDGRKYEHYKQLAMNKVSGFALQWRDDWRYFEPETAIPGNMTVGETLADIKRAHSEGLLDFMLVMHVYMCRGVRESWFDCSSDEDLEELYKRCEYALEAGVSHIIICFDDWTPSEDGQYVPPNATEREMFGNSAGAAHGYLAKRLYERMNPEWPEAKLTICQSPYSLNHLKQLPKNIDYMKDFEKYAPEDVGLIWTGGEVITRNVTEEDYQQYMQYTPKRRIILWDNSECFDAPLPMWETTLFPGYAKASDGEIFINLHTFGWWRCWPMLIGENAYCWNPKNYDARYYYAQGVDQSTGVAGSGEFLLSVRDRYLQMLQANSERDKALTITLIDELLAELKKFPEYNLPIDDLHSTLTNLRNRQNLELLTLEVPVWKNYQGDDWTKDATRYDLYLNGVKNTENRGNYGYIAVVNGLLKLKLVVTSDQLQELPEEAVCNRDDDAVYEHPENIETFILPRFEGVYGHLAMDIFGNICDSFGDYGGQGGDSWNPDWQREITRNAEGWTAEITLPLSELEKLTPPAPGKGVEWRFNQIYKPIHGARQSVATLEFGHHAPDSFAVLQFVEQD